VAMSKLTLAAVAAPWAAVAESGAVVAAPWLAGALTWAARTAT
jgi:hypothetical protein